LAVQKEAATMGDWICIKEAAEILGYSGAYFRKAFCSPNNPLVVLRSRRGPSGRRRLLVSRPSVEWLMAGEVQVPPKARETKEE
jgi:hypothetical protein